MTVKMTSFQRSVDRSARHKAALNNPNLVDNHGGINCIISLEYVNEGFQIDSPLEPGKRKMRTERFIITLVSMAAQAYIDFSGNGGDIFRTGFHARPNDSWTSQVRKCANTSYLH